MADKLRLEQLALIDTNCSLYWLYTVYVKCKILHRQNNWCIMSNVQPSYTSRLHEFIN